MEDLVTRVTNETRRSDWQQVEKMTYRTQSATNNEFIKNITLREVWYVYRAKLILFHGVEGELQLCALIFIQVFPALSHLVQWRQRI